MDKSYEEALFLRANVIGYAEKFKDEILNTFRINRLLALNSIKKYNNCKEARIKSGKVSIKDMFTHYWDEL